MMYCRLLLAAALAISASAVSAQQVAALRVCLPEDSAPYSFVERGQARGFDVDLLKSTAQRIGRELKAVWFESRYEKERNLSLEARALLAAGVCDLVAGIPLYEPHLVPMLADRARTPDYPGAKPLRQRPWQTLVPVVGGAPYRAAALMLVARDAQEASTTSLEALKGRAVAVRAGSMASMALGAWRGGVLASSIRGFNSHEDVLAGLEARQADFALVEVGLWDRYFSGHPQTLMRPTAFDHPVKINIGLLARASDEALLREMNAALATEQASGRAAAIAGGAGTTWVAPVLPTVHPVLTLRDFAEASAHIQSFKVTQ